MVKCNCELCSRASRNFLDAAGWMEWVEHTDAYTIRVHLRRDLYFYVEDALTGMYYMTRDCSEPLPAEKAGITSFDLQHWLEEKRCEAVPISRTPFRHHLPRRNRGGYSSHEIKPLLAL